MFSLYPFLLFVDLDGGLNADDRMLPIARRAPPGGVQLSTMPSTHTKVAHGLSSD
tara:strand:+ start:65 stop:229 length:165 start_codon:yes stop_codon:yes gene_type:complete